METILVTGAAGFIGSKVVEQLLKQGNKVVGIDNLNTYYDIRLKQWRLKKLQDYEEFSFHKVDIENYNALRMLFDFYKFNAVINDAARAGVRYSMENPFIYMSTNASGTLNLLELCREYIVNKFVLASTSSLYAGQKMPFKETLEVNTPISPYAASKKAAEMMSFTFHYLYGLDVSIVRYFTVYGPAGRPDMSIYRFIKWCLEGTPLEVFGDGTQKRDFTYIEDIATGTIKALRPLGFEIINLGNNNPNMLSEAISLIEKYTETKAGFCYKDFHIADLTATCANIDKAKKLLDWEPKTNLEEGIQRTVQWTKDNWNWLKVIKV